MAITKGRHQKQYLFFIVIVVVVICSKHGFIPLALAKAKNITTYVTSSSMGEKILFGRIERVLLFKDKITYKAKLDTGAKISSLLAINIREFKSAGKLWVAFQTIDPKTKNLINKEFPVYRYMYIKQHHNGDNKRVKHVKRPVIQLPVCLGNMVKIIKINLVDRRHFLYPVLLGRDAIVQFKGVIDPSKIYISTPSCEAVS